MTRPPELASLSDERSSSPPTYLKGTTFFREAMPTAGRPVMMREGRHPPMRDQRGPPPSPSSDCLWCLYRRTRPPGSKVQVEAGGWTLFTSRTPPIPAKGDLTRPIRMGRVMVRGVTVRRDNSRAERREVATQSLINAPFSTLSDFSGGDCWDQKSGGNSDL